MSAGAAASPASPVGEGQSAALSRRLRCRRIAVLASTRTRALLLRHSGQAPVPLRPGRRRADALGVRHRTRQLRALPRRHAAAGDARRAVPLRPATGARAPAEPPMTRPANASTTANAIRRGASGSAPSTSRAMRPRRRCTASPAASWCSARRRDRGQRPGLEPERPHDVLDRHQGPLHHLRLRLRAGHGRDRRPARIRALPAQTGRASRSSATAAGPTARRSTPKAATGWRCSRASACCASPTGEVLREVKLPVRCATMPLRRGRPEDDLPHHSARRACGRTRGAALGRLRAGLDVDVPGCRSTSRAEAGWAQGASSRASASRTSPTLRISLSRCGAPSRP